MIAAALGYRVKLCLPTSVSEERKRIVKAYGAEVIYTDPGEGSDGAIVKARGAGTAAEPGTNSDADQYSQRRGSGWPALSRNRQRNLAADPGKSITHFVATLGTAGTFMGRTRRLKELNPGIQCISLQPDSPFHGIEGAKYMPASIVPKIYDPALADRNLEIGTEESYAMVKRLAREEGLLVGISAAAALVGARRIAQEIPADQRPVIVCIFCDSADKYASASASGIHKILQETLFYR